MCDENDRIMIDKHVVTDRGSIDAVLAYFEEAEFEVPPLVVEGDPELVGRTDDGEGSGHA